MDRQHENSTIRADERSKGQNPAPQQTHAHAQKPPQSKPTSKHGKLAQWGIAALSFGVLGGMIYWGMQLVERDPSDVPVIAALEGPARVAPSEEERGGAQAENLGLAVNKIQTGTGADTAPDRVVLAPEDETLLPEELTAPTVVATEAPAVETASNTGETAEAEPASTEASVAPKALTDEEIDRMIAEATRNPESVPNVVTDAPAEEVEIAAAILPSDQPKLRPSEIEANVAAAARAVPQTQTPAPTAPAAPQPDAMANRVASVPVGTKLVQLGAYDSAALAEQEWQRLWTKHNDLLKSKSLLVQETVSGGRKFWRLRAAGFASGDEAQNLCTALNARGTACLALTVR